VDSTQCATTELSSTSLRCIWVPGESAGAECQAIKEWCEDITQGETTCNYPGVAFPKEAGTALSCVWIKNTEGGSCELKVCFILRKERRREREGRKVGEEEGGS
jgi:hypothetical protein